MTENLTPAVLVTHHSGWSEIQCNQPDRMNAFSDEMQAGLMAALTDAAADPSCRAVLLTGSGRAFCAGQDLTERDPRRRSGPPDLGKSVRERYNPLVTLLREMPKPVVCAVNGMAAGAGVGIALACDIVLAAEQAVFLLAFSKLGLVPDAGSSWALTRALGAPRARALAMTGGRLTAGQAADWGLIWQALPAADLMPEARRLTEELSKGPSLALGLIKAVVRAADQNDFATQIALEAALQDQCGRNPDYDEGVLAFLEKRPARFAGVESTDPPERAVDSKP